MVKTMLLVSPMVSEVLQNTKFSNLEKWEKKYHTAIYNGYELLHSDVWEGQFDKNIYPGRATDAVFKQLPPAIICTSEFDCLRRDSYKLKEQLQKLGKLLDFVDMPGVHHGY